MAKLIVSIAVIKVAIGVKRAELMSLHQDHDKPFRTFATCVRRKTETLKKVSKRERGNRDVTSFTGHR